MQTCKNENTVEKSEVDSQLQKEFAKNTIQMLKKAIWQAIKLYAPSDKYHPEIRKAVDSGIFKNISEHGMLTEGYEEIFSQQKSVIKAFLYALTNLAESYPTLFYQEYLKQNEIFARAALKSQKIKKWKEMKKQQKIQEKLKKNWNHDTQGIPTTLQMDFDEEIEKLKREYLKQKNANLEVAVLNALVQRKLALSNGKQFYGKEKQMYSDKFCGSNNKQLEYRTNKLQEKLRARLKHLL